VIQTLLRAQNCLSLVNSYNISLHFLLVVFVCHFTSGWTFTQKSLCQSTFSITTRAGGDKSLSTWPCASHRLVHGSVGHVWTKRANRLVPTILTYLLLKMRVQGRYRQAVATIQLHYGIIKSLVYLLCFYLSLCLLLVLLVYELLFKGRPIDRQLF